MRNFTVLCFILLYTLTSFSQKQRHGYNSPPGTIKLNDSLYIDVAPVDNIMYLEFLHGYNSFWSEKTHDSLAKLPNFGLKNSIPTYNQNENFNFHPKYN